MINELIEATSARNGEQPTSTQVMLAYLNSSLCSSSFNLVQFCLEKGMDMSNIISISRLFSFGEALLREYWSYVLQSNPAEIEDLKNADILYREMVFYEKSHCEHAPISTRTLNSLGLSSDFVERFLESHSYAILKALEENQKLVKNNYQYLVDLGVKNSQDIFLQYYELFLMDYSNFTGIFNKYDRDDLVEKLEKNIAIVEYL